MLTRATVTAISIVLRHALRLHLHEAVVGSFATSAGQPDVRKPLARRQVLDIPIDPSRKAGAPLPCVGPAAQGLATRRQIDDLLVPYRSEKGKRCLACSWHSLLHLPSRRRIHFSGPSLRPRSRTNTAPSQRRIHDGLGCSATQNRGCRLASRFLAAPQKGHFPCSQCGRRRDSVQWRKARTIALRAARYPGGAAKWGGRTNSRVSRESETSV